MNDVVSMDERLAYMADQIRVLPRLYYRGNYYLVPVWVQSGVMQNIFVFTIDEKPIGFVANFNENGVVDVLTDSTEIDVVKRIRKDRIWKDFWPDMSCK